MNFGTILSRFILLITILGALVSCQQEPGPDLSQLVESSITPTLESTQQASTATITKASPTRLAHTPEPTLTIVSSETPTPMPDVQEVSSFSVMNYSDEESETPSIPQAEPSTSTPAPTSKPEAAATPTVTITPEREADAHAIIEWQKLDLPDTFRAIYPQDLGVEIGATAVYFTDSNGEPIIIPIENSFVFLDDAETSFIFGYSYILYNPDLRNAFAAKQGDLKYLETQVLSPTLIDMSEIGDASGGYSGLLSDEERIESVDFLIGEVGASVLLRYPEDEPPPIDVIELAQVYAESLLNPEPRCEFLSITPVEGSFWPAYEFEASGFFPREQRIVELSGNVQKGEEILSASWNMLGQTGETSDQDGRVIGTITSGPPQEGIIPTNSDMTLTITGGFSGCEVSERVPWPGQGVISEQLAEYDSDSSPVSTIEWDYLPQGHIAFQSYSEGSGGIQSLDLQTGEIEALTYTPATGDWFPEWSPSGTELLFSTDADVFGEEIYLLKSDGSYIRLTDNSVVDTHAVWSPDGSEIAFASDAAGNIDVYLMDIATGEVSQLTQHEGLDWFPSWSPDGQQIVFESDRDGNYELYKINRDGSDLVRLTEHDAIDTSPAWSPDGAKIAFNSSRSGIFQIHVLDLVSGEIVQLTNGSKENRHPEWSPNGLFIAYDSMTDETSDIFIMKADGTDQQQITHDPANETYPSWAGERAEFEIKPYWHRPFCAIDTDGDNFPDSPAETWPLNEELYFIVFFFRNMEDGKEWSHTWTNLNTGASSFVPAVWDGGEAGAKTIYSNLVNQGPSVWEIEFRLEGELMDVIQCPVVE
jgi:Tol biopolymer transport system component